MAITAFSHGVKAGTSSAPWSEPASKAFELEETTIAELQAAMKSGRFTAQSMVAKYLTRIEEVDKRGPRVNSVI